MSDLNNVVQFPGTPANSHGTANNLGDPALTDAELEAAVDAIEVAELQAATNAIRETAAAQQAGALPTKTQKYTTFGFVKGEKVSQEFQIRVPVGMPDHDQANLMLWDAISKVGGLTVKVDNTHYKMYPLSTFDGPLELEVGIVTGNSLV